MAKTVLAVFFGLMGVLTVVFSVREPAVEGLPRNYTKPMLALEMMRSAPEVQTVSARFPKGDEGIWTAIKADFALIIPAYTLLFIGFAWLAKTKRLPAWELLITTAMFAALADVRENMQILGSQPAFFPAAIKWFLLGIAFALMCVIFAKSGGVLLLPAAFCLAAAIVLIGGVWIVGLLEAGFITRIADAAAAGSMN